MFDLSLWLRIPIAAVGQAFAGTWLHQRLKIDLLGRPQAAPAKSANQ
jgi:hypothetical protein